MTETTARTYHTMESLRQMTQTDLRNVNREELVDINEVEIRKDLSQRGADGRFHFADQEPLLLS